MLWVPQQFHLTHKALPDHWSSHWHFFPLCFTAFVQNRRWHRWWENEDCWSERSNVWRMCSGPGPKCMARFDKALLASLGMTGMPSVPFWMAEDLCLGHLQTAAWSSACPGRNYTFKVSISYFPRKKWSNVCILAYVMCTGKVEATRNTVKFQI